MSIDWLKRLLGIQPPPTDSTTGVLCQQFSCARFNWRSNPDAQPLLLTITLQDMRDDGSGLTTANLNLCHDGLRADATVSAWESRSTIYLGEIVVPGPLKRQGLATATMVAMSQALELAECGKTLNRAISLRGTFVNEGVKFSRSICEGVPDKQEASGLRESVVQRARAQLTLCAAPALVSTSRLR